MIDRAKSHRRQEIVDVFVVKYDTDDGDSRVARFLTRHEAVNFSTWRKFGSAHATVEKSRLAQDQAARYGLRRTMVR